MNINFQNNNELNNAFNLINEEFKFDGLDLDYEVIFIKSNENNFKFNQDRSLLTINYKTNKDALFAFFKSIQCRQNNDCIVINKKIPTLTYMIDLSRNSVYKVGTLKRLINYLVVMGYDAIGLYMEDTYEIKEDPYFGKFRGRLSLDELKEIVDYASIFEFEVVPYIQTLGHLATLFDYPKYWKILEHQDFLMLRKEETYNFIELMFKNIRSVFKTNRIHVGMDEVTLLGRTRFLDEFGYVDKKELLIEHLYKVREIAKKYNFDISIWSDVFFTSTSIHAYNDVKIDSTLKVPDDVTLYFWKYEHLSSEEYDKIFAAHKQIAKNIAYAGGAWKWLGFAPNNTYSLKHLKNSMEASIRNEIKEYVVTGWGDNGGETSSFAILPSLYFAGNLNSNFQNNDDEFKLLTNLTFDEFMKVDELNLAPEVDLSIHLNSYNRMFLFGDLLMGTYDQFIKKEQVLIYHKLKTVYKKMMNTKFGYIFKEYYELANVLETKCLIVNSLRNNYLNRDFDGLKENVTEMKRLLRQLNLFIQSFKEAWDIESKPQGFDVQDLRLGGLKERIKHTIEKVEKILNGTIDKIEELDEERVDFFGQGENLIYRPNLHDPRVKAIQTKNPNY